jgi:tRNA A37 methylthiotransferase MiaB
MRIRFTSPHPKDFGPDCIDAIAAHANICNHLHMPAQSGSSAVLERMRRGYTRAAYDALVRRARDKLPDVAFSTDIIVGFCGETEAEHEETLDLLEQMRYSLGFLFAYSRREKTHAARRYEDDVPPEVKRRRLQEALQVYDDGVRSRRAEIAGSRQLVRNRCLAPIALPSYTCCCPARSLMNNSPVRVLRICSPRCVQYMCFHD